MIEITVPVLPESVTEGTLTTWCKQEGEHVKRDDVIAELETDKVILEIPAPHDGVLSNIIVSEGSTVTSAQLLAHLKPQAVIEETVTPVTETLAMPSAILSTTSMGFLGLGAQQPLPDWGWILQNGIQYINKAAWISMAPGLAIVWTVLSFNLVGEGVKELLDPRARV